LGLFKFIKKFFKGIDVSTEEVKQSDVSIDSDVKTSCEFPIKKRKRRYVQKTWQMSGDNPAGETSIVIGFDLGTSCTKVIVQDVVLKKAYAVSFNGMACEGNPFLMPTKFTVDLNGDFSLSHDGKIIDALKMRFLHQPDQSIEISKNTNFSAAEALTAYIALVLIEVREWFWSEKQSDYKSVKIDWQLNIGMSSRSYDDNKLNDLMKHVALAGWNLTLNQAETINVKDLKPAMVTANHQISNSVFDERDQQIHPDNVCPIPEIIAQVVGYARSPMRQDGMYLIVDIGASTMDVSNFIIHQNEGDDLYSILVAEVEKLGASILHRYRITCAETIIREYFSDVDGEKFKKDALKTIRQSFDGIAPPPKIEDHFPALPKEALRDFRKASGEFVAECSRIIRKVIKESMFKRNPKSTAWQYGLPVFLCGGGSQIGTYQSIIPHAEQKLSSTSFHGFEQMQIPKPANLETADIPPRDYHRMSVAYGLSFPCIDIGEIIPPGSIPDLICDSKIRNVSDNFIDKDMV
jgi:hypothetical protein